ncbi:hypothetical protein HanIR_Chr04g0176021 [Helianthus annuus]|nr:hypothetical protein HanIR_Chr04g0176021 [Helianthus annuus]
MNSRHFGKCLVLFSRTSGHYKYHLVAQFYDSHFPTLPISVVIYSRLILASETMSV